MTGLIPIAAPLGDEPSAGRFVANNELGIYIGNYFEMEEWLPNIVAYYSFNL